MTKADTKSLQMLKDKYSQIADLQEAYKPEEFDAWRTETTLILEHIFGEKSDKVERFKSFNGTLGVYWDGESDSALTQRKQNAYFSDLKSAHSFLSGLINFLQMMVEQFSSKEPQKRIERAEISIAGDYVMHPIIVDVAGSLYTSGYYRDAVRAAFIEVIDQVKQKGGHPTDKDGNELDGDKLMNHMFGSESRTPTIHWANLDNRAQKDFQQGMLYLFKGVVGLRNEKGHMNVEQKDKDKAFEYLALASLLIRELDEVI